MPNSILGVLTLLGVAAVCLMERKTSTIQIFDWHAAVIVFGGVLGSLMIALDWHSLGRLFDSAFDLFRGRSQSGGRLKRTQEEFATLREAWRNGRRAVILELLESSEALEIKAAAESLIAQEPSHRMEERFADVRVQYLREEQPVVEGWDMVARLAPSFGMVGTVSGMVQLFREMGSISAGLGGAMATALLATLYGITFGTAFGGPMSTRLNNQLNERLNLIDLIEKSVVALVNEGRKAK